MANWLPTNNYSNVIDQMTFFRFDMGIGVKTNLEAIIYDHITSFAKGEKKTQKLVFPCLITNILQRRHLLILRNETTIGVSPNLVMFRLKSPVEDREEEESSKAGGLVHTKGERSQHQPLNQQFSKF